MSQIVVQELVAKFTGDTTGLNTASASASKAISTLHSKIAGLVSAAAAIKFGQYALQTLAWADDLGDLALTVGVTAEKLQALQYAAIANGSSVNELNTALVKFTQVVGDAYVNGGALAEQMQILGIRGLDSNGVLLSTSEILPQVADAIQKATSAQEKLSIATDFFGRSAAPSMARMLSAGAEGLSELEVAAFNAGAVLSEDVVSAAAKTNGQFELFSLTLSQNVKSAILGIIADFQQMGVELGQIATAANYAGRALLEMNGIDTFRNSALNEQIKLRDRLTQQWAANPENAALKQQIDLLNENIKKTRDLYHERVLANQSAPPPSPVASPRGSTYISPIGSGSEKESTESAKSSIERATKSLDKFKQNVKETRYVMDDFDVKSKDTFSDMIKSIAKGEDAMDSLRRTALDVIGDIADSMFNMAFGGSSGGGLGGSIAGALGNAIGGWFGTGKTGQAVGGKLKSFAVGTDYVPQDMIANIHKGEMIIPAREAEQMRRGGGGNSQTVNQTINVSAGVSQTVRAEITRMLPQIRQMAISGVADNGRRNLQGAF
jgi:hypothetical protein